MNIILIILYYIYKYTSLLIFLNEKLIIYVTINLYLKIQTNQKYNLYHLLSDIGMNSHLIIWNWRGQIYT